MLLLSSIHPPDPTKSVCAQPQEMPTGCADLASAFPELQDPQDLMRPLGTAQKSPCEDKDMVTEESFAFKLSCGCAVLS